MRRLGGPPEPDRRYSERPGAYGVILNGRDALLVETDCVGEEIALPGGGIDPGESPVRALHREALEETGWRVAPLRRIWRFQRYTYMPEYDLWAHKVCHVFLCRAIRRLGPPMEAGHRPFWVDIADAPPILDVEGDRMATAAVAGFMSR